MLKRFFSRKQYIIKPIFQLKISAIIVTTLLVATLITASFLYLNILNSILPEFSAEKLKQRVEMSRAMRKQGKTLTSKEIEEERMFISLFPESARVLSDYERSTVIQILHEVNRSLVPWILILVALILSAGIFITHRIAGPIYRFEQTIDKVRKGNLTIRTNLRWSDEFKDLSNLMNEAISSLDKSTQEAKGLIKKIKESNKASDIKEDLAKLEKILNFYKTS